MSSKILVTGASGFLGSHIADALSDLGHQVTVFDLHDSP
ncbi:MAG: UDP-glucose 4-epimerase [Roseivirga sp.]|jgi:UDP-glucose 4-epimerase